MCAPARWSWLEHVLQSSSDGSSDASTWLGLGAQTSAQVLLWMLPWKCFLNEINI